MAVSPTANAAGTRHPRSRGKVLLFEPLEGAR